MSKIKLLSLIAFSAIGLLLHAADTTTVRYLETYDQLSNFRGSGYLYYVRNAGKTPHGDPTVRSGWAVYSWDKSLNKWQMINKYDVMEMASYDPTGFMTKSFYYADINPWKERIVSVEHLSAVNAIENAKIKASLQVVTNQISVLTTDVAGLKTDMTDQKAKTTQLRYDVDALKGRADTNDLEVASIKGRTTVVEGKVALLEEYKLTNDVEIAAIKQKDISQDTMIAENAVTAKTYTDTQVGAQSNYVNNVVVPALDDKINDKYDAAVAYTDGVKLELNNRISAEKTDIMTNVGERVRSLRIRLEGEISDTRTFAGNAAVSNAAIALAQSKVFTTNKVDEALVEAKGYADTKKSEAIASAKGYTDESIVTAKAELNETIAGVKTVATNAQTIANKTTRDLAHYKTEVDAQFTTERNKTTRDIGTAKTEAETFAVQYGNGIYGQAVAFTTNKLDAADLAQLEAGTTKFATKKNIEDAVAGEHFFPLRVKKGDIVYTLDVVDDGSGDITLKITK